MIRQYEGGGEKGIVSQDFPSHVALQCSIIKYRYRTGRPESIVEC